jgi:hypothetical protein
MMTTFNGITEGDEVRHATTGVIYIVLSVPSKLLCLVHTPFTDVRTVLQSYLLEVI